MGRRRHTPEEIITALREAEVGLAIGGGDDIAFPIPDLELDANPNLTSTMACPAGQTVGSWR